MNTVTSFRRSAGVLAVKTVLTFGPEHYVPDSSRASAWFFAAIAELAPGAPGERKCSAPRGGSADERVSGRKENRAGGPILEGPPGRRENLAETASESCIDDAAYRGNRSWHAAERSCPVAT